jgi:GGDEF domain-containing protein
MNDSSRIEYLSTDTAFGILTRPALELKLSSMSDERIARIFVLDLNDIHRLNNSLGYGVVNEKITYILSELHRQFPSLIIGRVFSGDEIAIVENGNSYFDIEHSAIPVFECQGISFKYVYMESKFGMHPGVYSHIFTQLSEKLRTRKFYQII